MPLRVAVMGCVVNGPGEAREADLGVASGNGKGQIFVKGEVIKTVPESQIVETLIEEAMRLAEGMEPVEGSEASVTVCRRRLAPLSVGPRGVGSDRAEDSRAGARAGPGRPGRFVALAEQDPVVNVFADYRARLTNLDERWLGGQVWGRFEGDELVAGCHLGANLVPVQCTPDDVGAFADARAASAQQRRHDRRAAATSWPRCGSWSSRAGTARARSVPGSRTSQIDRPPTVAPDPDVRPHHARRPRPALPGLRGDVHRGGRCLARRATRAAATSTARGSSSSSGAAGRWRASTTHGVVFKAEVACVTPYAAQVQGVWVRPDRRGEGLADGGMAAVVSQ